ncbi:MAG: shikimate dehydrogenase [Pyrinomonadaceae bacterium]
MNNGKICIPVCAETVGELVEQIKRAEDLADVIEIRFDCLSKNEFDVLDENSMPSVYKKILDVKTNKILLTTFRAKEQGGHRELAQEERDVFWNSGYEIGWADCEEDIIEDSWSWLWDKRICSFHDFNGFPNNLFEIYERLKATNADIIKVAIQTHDIADTIPVWKLLEKWNAEKENLKAKKLKWIEELEKKINSSLPRPISFLQIIPIAMGESGKWTRILGLPHGAFMTYAALDAGRETAPGQVSAKDLIEVYRVKELDEQTEIYGIIGGNTAYSMSPYIHNAAFKFHKLNSVFVPLQMQNLDEFIKRMVMSETREIELNFKGFAVTIPHKQAIIKHLDYLDESAEKIGAVNTVKIENGKLYGYNTDAHGFIEPLKNAYGELKNVKVAVLGAGGAARACIYALKTEGAEVTIFARDLSKAKKLAEEFQVELQELKTQNSKLETFEIVVNATPLGTKGELERETPATSEQLKNIQLAYDLVYNPFETRFLREAKNADVPTIGGMAMLIAQAMKQQKIWTDLDAPMKEMSQAALQKLK